MCARAYVSVRIEQLLGHKEGTDTKQTPVYTLIHAFGLSSVAGGEAERDASEDRGCVPLPQGARVSVGVLLLALGVVLVMFATVYTAVIGTSIAALGFCVLIYSFCQVMKSSSHNMTLPGHFLLHPRTGTRFTYEQAIALQRRLDRIRRASAEERRLAQPPPPADNSFHSLPGTPPPWDMEPPPSYETVMKTTTALNQL
ncbi:uncharacterized protein si:dkeyp-51f12.3 [Trichomycterus rosablanca]|uniref:uncharacterized protein si:dkeyp-51f12.3 n=1 Tax=Trichomycterus rosablanca TaxID=2290929 RepID=UPI002F35F501